MIKLLALVAIIGLIYLFAGCLAKAAGLDAPECDCDETRCGSGSKNSND